MQITGRQRYQDNQEPVTAIEGRKRLSRKWWIVLVVLAFSAWAFFAAMGLMPLWLWLLILATLISVALGIALFGPKRVLVECYKQECGRPAGLIWTILTLT